MPTLYAIAARKVAEGFHPTAAVRAIGCGGTLETLRRRAARELNRAERLGEPDGPELRPEIRLVWRRHAARLRDEIAEADRWLGRKGT